MNLEYDKTGIIAATVAASSFKYGDVISKEWLFDALKIKQVAYGSLQDFQKMQFDFLQSFEDFKVELLENHKMALENVRGVGYRIVSPGEQAEYAMKTLKKDVKKAINQAVNILTNVNESLLSLDESKKLDESRGKVAALAAFGSQKKIT